MRFFGVFFFLSLVALTRMKSRHSVLQGLITVIIRTLDFGLFHFARE